MQFKFVKLSHLRRCRANGVTHIDKAMPHVTGRIPCSQIWLFPFLMAVHSCGELIDGI